MFAQFEGKSIYEINSSPGETWVLMLSFDNLSHCFSKIIMKLSVSLQIFCLGKAYTCDFSIKHSIKEKW